MELQKAKEIQERINRFKFLVAWAEEEKGLPSLEQKEINTLKDTVKLLTELIEEIEQIEDVSLKTKQLATERITGLEKELQQLRVEN